MRSRQKTRSRHTGIHQFAKGTFIKDLQQPLKKIDALIDGQMATDRMNKTSAMVGLYHQSDHNAHANFRPNSNSLNSVSWHSQFGILRQSIFFFCLLLVNITWAINIQS
ncbi:hypothetical protein EmuJ_001154500 [Echinococcus multilocularis]|uniref:Uncharacterized protein n=1 Tax=Echinococcus multilocularis TaxID=6211 RepID=A0A068YGN3_ECHMU|nr:hypothetical protein EmuJ_001154500 [Echinococcus multilocularis]